MIDLKKEAFVAIEDQLAALEIERPKTGFMLYIFLNRCAALLLYILLSPFLAALFVLLVLGIRFPLLTRVKRIAPDLRELARGKLRLRVFDMTYLGPADLTKQPVGHNPDPLTALPHFIARLGNLTNVIKGDILLVGNRPMDPEIAFSITEEYRRTRLTCQGGVISILDTNEVDEGTEEEQVISEGYYAVNRTFWMDMGVLARGLWRLFWRMLGAKKVVREYRPIPQEESASFE
jgi:lipopolysaccharide/colanic/teichoic acid biosynthesis glycosyltransferase